MENYKKRIIDPMLAQRLKNKGAILVEGAKWCGKTTMCETHAESILYMDDPDTVDQNLELAGISPKTLLLGKNPRLIDEWQLAPKLWDTVRYEVDHRQGFGHFILTGSSVPADLSEIHHSGTGRIARMKMRPMSLYESEDSNGSVSLGALFSSPESIEGVSNTDLNQLAFLVCRGGWPLSTFLDGEDALVQARDYVDGVVNSDISRADGVRRNPEIAKLILRSYSRHQGTSASIATICEDIKAKDALDVSSATVISYLNALRTIFVVEDSSAWSPNLRSKTTIRTSETRYFVDPSIAAASLGIGPGDLVNDLESFGFLFETMCIRDLRVYAESLDGEIKHFRTKENLECDAVIHLRNGNYGLAEIKLGGSKLIEEGAKNLKKIESLLDTTKMKAPSFLMVLSGTTSYAYRREDGVYVVPIACLKN